MANQSSRLLARKKANRFAKSRLSNYSAPSLSRKGVSSNQAQAAVNEYSLLNYAVGYMGATPRRVSLTNMDIWIVPVVLTSPGYGIVGEVGVVVVHASTGKIVGASSRDEVRAAGAKLAKEKRDELDVAFHRARTV